MTTPEDIQLAIEVEEALNPTVHFKVRRKEFPNEQTTACDPAASYWQNYDRLGWQTHGGNQPICQVCSSWAWRNDRR